MEKFGLRFVLIIIITSGYWLVAGNSRAQGAPELLITWQANNFVPSGYQGKALPTRGTVINAALELVDARKPADLSRGQISWFVNGHLYKSGSNLKNFSFPLPGFSDGNYALKAIVNYHGRKLEKTVQIPTVDPEVVIDAPYANKKIVSGANIFRALPLFFNVNGINQLLFSWSANNQTVSGETESPDLLELDAAGGRPGNQIHLTVNVTSKLNQLEISGYDVDLEIR